MSYDSRKRLQLYGMVKSLGYVVHANDLKTAQHLRARLAGALKYVDDRAEPLHDDVKELFQISGLWVRNVGNRHDTKRQIQELIRRIVPQLKTRSR
jgi:hypothetical protein